MTTQTYTLFMLLKTTRRWLDLEPKVRFAYIKENVNPIVRQPHRYHGRIQQIDLSETGKSLLAACRERVHGIERHLADGLSREEESALRKWLVRVATSA